MHKYNESIGDDLSWGESSLKFQYQWIKANGTSQEQTQSTRQQKDEEYA